jgi:hypothetical protein
VLINSLIHKVETKQLTKSLKQRSQSELNKKG